MFKIGEEDRGLVIDFNPEERTAEIARKDPIKFRYFIKVRLSKDGPKWCYAGGENTQDLQPSPENSTWLSKKLCTPYLALKFRNASSSRLGRPARYMISPP